MPEIFGGLVESLEFDAIGSFLFILRIHIPFQRMLYSALREYPIVSRSFMKSSDFRSPFMQWWAPLPEKKILLPCPTRFVQFFLSARELSAAVLPSPFFIPTPDKSHKFK
jgi:hypothetical protein